MVVDKRNGRRGGSTSGPQCLDMVHTSVSVSRTYHRPTNGVEGTSMPRADDCNSGFSHRHAKVRGMINGRNVGSSHTCGRTVVVGCLGDSRGHCLANVADTGGHDLLSPHGADNRGNVSLDTDDRAVMLLHGGSGDSVALMGGGRQVLIFCNCLESNQGNQQSDEVSREAHCVHSPIRGES